jgi:hypothetical protein
MLKNKKKIILLYFQIKNTLHQSVIHSNKNMFGIVVTIVFQSVFYLKTYRNHIFIKKKLFLTLIY